MQIKTDEEYKAALDEIQKLWHAEINTPAGDKLKEHIECVDEYENEHYPITESTKDIKKKISEQSGKILVDTSIEEMRNGSPPRKWVDAE